MKSREQAVEDAVEETIGELDAGLSDASKEELRALLAVAFEAHPVMSALVREQLVRPAPVETGDVSTSGEEEAKRRRHGNE